MRADRARPLGEIFMFSRRTSSALVAALALLLAGPAAAAVTIITQQKALAGNVTPGDDPGFPVELTRRGAYRLDTDLAVPAGTFGIQIKSQFVDIDMNGFTLFGWNAAGTNRAAKNGIYSTYGVGSIRGGYISGFKFAGINLTGSKQWVVEDMFIQSNGAEGIVASSYTRVLNSSIYANLSTGIICGLYCHIEGNSIVSNEGYGLTLSNGMVIGNSIFDNKFQGVGSIGVDSEIGFGNNTLVGNNVGFGMGEQTPPGLQEFQPNACSSSC